MMSKHEMGRRIAVLGAGNIGISIAKGLLRSDLIKPADLILTRRRTYLLSDLEKSGVAVTKDNMEAVAASEIIIIAVEPQQLNGLLREIKPYLLKEKHIIMSVVTGVGTSQISGIIGDEMAIVRAMPNIAIAVGESMTCLASNGNRDESLKIACELFDTVGKTLVITEDEMIAATAIGACGVAFFLRAIRAASQGGIEVGLQSDQSLMIATQAALGAASLLLSADRHPEQEIDKVTTPKGCTIAGLNLMEYEGFSSAMIKGIALSAKKAEELYSGDNK